MKNPKFNPGELISNLLIEFRQNKIKIREKHPKEIDEIKPKGRKFELNDKALEIYNELARGTRAYLINGLLRR